MGVYLYTVVEVFYDKVGKWCFSYSNIHDECQESGKGLENDLYTNFKDYPLQGVLGDFRRTGEGPYDPYGHRLPDDCTKEARQVLDDTSDRGFGTVAELFDGEFNLLKRLDEVALKYDAGWSFLRVRDKVLPALRALGPADKVRVLWGRD